VNIKESKTRSEKECQECKESKECSETLECKGVRRDQGVQGVTKGVKGVDGMCEDSSGAQDVTTVSFRLLSPKYLQIAICSCFCI